MNSDMRRLAETACAVICWPPPFGTNPANLVLLLNVDKMEAQDAQEPVDSRAKKKVLHSGTLRLRRRLGHPS